MFQCIIAGYFNASSLIMERTCTFRNSALRENWKTSDPSATACASVLIRLVSFIKNIDEDKYSSEKDRV